MSRAETSKLFPAWLISIFKPHLAFVCSSEMQILDNHFQNWVSSVEPVFVYEYAFYTYICLSQISSSNIKSFRKNQKENKSEKQKLYAWTIRFMVEPNEMKWEGSFSSWPVGRLGDASIVEPQTKYHLQKSSLALRDSERVTLCLMSKWQ